MKTYLASVILAVSVFLSESAQAVQPAAAGALSVVPGLGQTVGGHPLEGLAWFGSVVGLYSSGNKWARNVALEFWEYNMYDAYRDAGAKDTGKQTFLENELAFINPLNLVDPISVGIVGYGVYSGAHSKSAVKQGPRGTLAGIAFFSTVGLGEEGLFRGFLFPGFSHLTGSYIVGAVLSSGAFAAAHLVNHNKYYHSAHGLTTLFAGGMLLCLQTYSQKWDLRHSIFTHAWFDISVEYARIEAPQRFSLGNEAPMAQIKLDF
jgi:Type II CAAX prenyl endopeptidase Rce1-like